MLLDQTQPYTPEMTCCRKGSRYACGLPEPSSPGVPPLRSPWNRLQARQATTPALSMEITRARPRLKILPAPEGHHARIPPESSRTRTFGVCWARRGVHSGVINSDWEGEDIAASLLYAAQRLDHPTLAA